MQKKPKVLVMGATGQVGGSIIPLLAKDSSVEVIAAARNPNKAQHLGVPVVYLDLDKIEMFAPALDGIDRIFMATGYTIDMLRQSKDLVNTAKRAGVEQIVHLAHVETMIRAWRTMAGISSSNATSSRRASNSRIFVPRFSCRIYSDMAAKAM
jgi:putative NADH-flavin reductase